MVRLRFQANACCQRRLEVAESLIEQMVDFHGSALTVKVHNGVVEGFVDGAPVVFPAEVLVHLRELNCELPDSKEENSAILFNLRWNADVPEWDIRCQRCASYGF